MNLRSFCFDENVFSFSQSHEASKRGKESALLSFSSGSTQKIGIFTFNQLVKITYSALLLLTLLGPRPRACFGVHGPHVRVRRVCCVLMDHRAREQGFS